MKLPTLSSPLKLFSPAPAGPALGMAGATGGHMMFASSGGGRGGNYDQDDYGFEDEYDDEPLGEPEGEEPQRPRSRRTVRSSGNAGPTGGQPRVAQLQPEERYWTDYLRIALPVIGLLLMIGLLWFWATQLIGDSPDTTDPATEVVGLVNQGTPEPTDQPAQTQPTQTQGNTIGIGDTASTPESSGEDAQATEDPAMGDNQARTGDTTDDTGDATFASGDPVVVIEEGVNVRPAASLAGDPVTMLNTGDQLTIASGPVEAEGYIWWEVILPTGDSGWVVEDFIQAAE